MAEKVIVKQSQLGVPIGNRTILGQLTSFEDGTAKWTYAKDVNPLQAGFGDRSTFTLSKKPDGTWSWAPTTSTSISNLAQRENLTVDEVNKSLYVKSGNLPTSQTQVVLNAGNTTNLGLNKAVKLGVPGSKGAATVTGPLPSQVSGAFSGQEGATPPVSSGEETQESTPVDPNELINNIKDKSGGVRTSYGNWVYPTSTRSTKQDRIKFTMYRYEAGKFNAQGIASGDAFGKRPLGSPFGSVTLPIQPTISDTNAVDWGGLTMNAGEEAFSGLSVAGMTGQIDPAVSGAQQSLSDPGQTGALKSAVIAGLAGRAASVNSTGTGLLQRLTGGIVNTNLELLFNGPQLRTFSFTFSMSARDQEEAKEIRSIIRFFKQGMSVKRASTNLFLKSPNVFTIRYLYGGSNGTDHPWINKIKECALTSCSVNYTPAGNYATYEDGAMTQYDITLSFGELDFIYDDEYGPGEGQNPETEISY